MKHFTVFFLLTAAVVIEVQSRQLLADSNDQSQDDVSGVRVKRCNYLLNFLRNMFKSPTPPPPPPPTTAPKKPEEPKKPEATTKKPDAPKTR